ncbi:hypothetical protein ACH42_04520 [Endozoicomonas sp. (ex Bugula neritina AB1)]|nr:hypothetical protein ACH42_04520 [Endozoicomonas sp. (ex Bugula neritina AB1)]
MATGANVCRYSTLARREAGLLDPRYCVILVNRSDLPLKELVRRHREKQGQENAQKGPLIDLDLHHPPCKKSPPDCARLYAKIGKTQTSQKIG